MISVGHLVAMLKHVEMQVYFSIQVSAEVNLFIVQMCSDIKSECKFVRAS